MNYCSAHQIPEPECPLCNKDTQQGVAMRPMTPEENHVLTAFTNAELGAVAENLERELATVAAERDTARATCAELVTDSNAIRLAETVVRITADRDALKVELATLGAACDKFRRADGELRAQLRAALAASQDMHAAQAAKLDALEKSISDLSHPNMRMLLDERDALIADKERLDYCDRMIDLEPSFYVLKFKVKKSCTIRDAIDAVRKEQP